MPNLTREISRVGSLLASTNRVEAPFVKVTLGNYSFGVYQKTKNKNEYASNKYPNYVQNLRIVKLNGTVNQYTLNIKYPITESSDPNFFDKLLSKTGIGGSIKFEYGDSMLPEYVYKDEKAIITDVRETLGVESAVIEYTISALSASTLTLSGSYLFTNKKAKPSDEIKKLIREPKYHLTEVFKGMKNEDIVNSLIASDDKEVEIPTCSNMSVLEYINVLVSYMAPVGSSSIIKSNVYALTTYEDITGAYGGPYFRVQKIQKSSSTLNQLCTYTVDIGYPSSNIVSNFTIDNKESWSIYYNYNESLSNSDYLKRINNNGTIEDFYSPQLSRSGLYLTEADSSWWTKVTQYPISASMTIKGLLRPSVLMSYIKINIWYFGHKHIASGYYIILEQTDNIGLNGYNTVLKLLRVGEDEEMI